MKKLLFFLVASVLISINLTMADTTISFFEEFPDEKTFEKVVSIDFDTRFYLAAKNLSEFYGFKEKIKNNHVQEVVYWPVLEREEGYWFSPWVEKSALERIFQEIKERENKEYLEVMLDLEFPLGRARLLNFEDFKENKKYISDFIKEAKGYNLGVITVEKSWLPDWILEPLGLSYKMEEYGHKKIKMYYSSFRRRFLPDFLVDKLFERKLRQFKKEGAIPALGCIATGIYGNEPLNSPEILEKELQSVKGENFSEVIIFRLAGINEGYPKVIKKYTS